MGKNLLVINVDIRETRVGLIENGIIAELHIERDAQKGTLGNIDRGRVSRVLPGLQAAFIDIGLERAAFLHVEDLIRPDDFEAYLAGGRKHARGEASGAGGAPVEDEDVPDIAAEAQVAAEAAVEAGTPLETVVVERPSQDRISDPVSDPELPPVSDPELPPVSDPELPAANDVSAAA